MTHPHFPRHRVAMAAPDRPPGRALRTRPRPGAAIAPETVQVEFAGAKR